MTRILLVDDHALFCDGFASMARHVPGWSVRTAECADSACTALAAEPADMVIVDAAMPGRNGFDLIEDLAARYPTMPRMVISAREDDGAQRRAQRSGANGFIGKREPAPIMIEKIKAVLAGKSTFADADTAMPVLTSRQQAILDLLAEGHGNKEIRHRLDIAERTVRAHLTELFQALGAQSRLQALLRAREFGLIE